MGMPQGVRVSLAAPKILNTVPRANNNLLRSLRQGGFLVCSDWSQKNESTFDSTFYSEQNLYVMKDIQSSMTLRYLIGSASQPRSASPCVPSNAKEAHSVLKKVRDVKGCQLVQVFN